MERKGTEAGLAAMAASYKKFDPAAYLQNNYTPPRADFERKHSIVPWKLACLHRAFNEGERMEGIASQCTCTKSKVISISLLQSQFQHFVTPKGVSDFLSDFS